MHSYNNNNLFIIIHKISFSNHKTKKRSQSQLLPSTKVSCFFYSTKTYDATARLLSSKVVDSIWNKTIIRIDADDVNFVNNEEIDDNFTKQLKRKKQQRN